MLDVKVVPFRTCEGKRLCLISFALYSKKACLLINPFDDGLVVRIRIFSEA
jgi:hypothetical protein